VFQQTLQQRWQRSWHPSSGTLPVALAAARAGTPDPRSIPFSQPVRRISSGS